MLVAALLLAALAGVVWFAWRPLPKTSGEISAAVRRTAKAVRDRLGVPHISAESLEDALFVQGYVTAQDRLWQLEATRRYAGGDLAEVAGAAAVAADRESRRLRTRRLAEEHYKRLDPKVRALFAEYARGINYFLETHRNALPLEFTIMRFDPRPWSVVDSILVCIHMFRDLTTTWRDEIEKRSMIDGGDARRVNALYPMRSGREPAPGSNAWAISGRFTASGRPLLANDTHLAYALPSTWYMVHLQTPPTSVAGVSVPGVPGVIIGHNERIAWGVTNLHFDVQDLYGERLNATTGHYAFRGQLLNARRERERIGVRNGRPIEVDNWVTHHGPVYINDGTSLLTLRWIAADPDGFDFPFFEVNAAQNWAEFRTALERFPGPAQNFVYADVDGNIGFQVAGRLPIRHACDGDLPADGSSGECEWDGFIPFEELPAIFNPPSGIIVTANQNPFPADYKYRVSGDFAPGYRAAQIRALLSARRGWRPEDMIAVQKDVYSAFSHFLAREIVRAYDARGRRNEQLRGAADILRGWNGQMEKDLAAPLIVALAYQQLRRAIADRASPKAGAAYESHMATAVVEGLLRERPRDWFGDWDELLLRCLQVALEDGRRQQGRNVANWEYGHYLELTIENPIARRVPWIGKYFHIGPVPQSGSSTTVKQTTRRIGPSMRFVAVPGDWDKSLLNITIGQSGQRLSRHYRDQWDAYYAGRSFPLPFS
ncbi:MAG TPA: penicillin acylase family protein, partial [Bryobacteraceae bacterium]|nr:penicillin acylase family protein [Bryobacteraceae bacterium]